MHLADAFIQSDLQCIQAIHLLSFTLKAGTHQADGRDSFLVFVSASENSDWMLNLANELINVKVRKTSK